MPMTALSSNPDNPAAKAQSCQLLASEIRKTKRAMPMPMPEKSPAQFQKFRRGVKWLLPRMNQAMQAATAAATMAEHPQFRISSLRVKNTRSWRVGEMERIRVEIATNTPQVEASGRGWWE